MRALVFEGNRKIVNNAREIEMAFRGRGGGNFRGGNHWHGSKIKRVARSYIYLSFLFSGEKEDFIFLHQILAFYIYIFS